MPRGPFIPFLVCSSMEYLSRLMKNQDANKEFKYHLRCSKLNVIQLGFADDLLLFSRGDVKSVQLLFNTFQQFSKAFGFRANPSKNSIYFRGVC